MTSDAEPQPSLWFRIKRFVRRMPAFERRWIADEAERERHDGLVRRRLRFIYRRWT